MIVSARLLASGGTTTGIEVPAEVVEALDSGKRARAAGTRARRIAAAVAAVTP